MLVNAFGIESVKGLDGDVVRIYILETFGCGSTDLIAYVSLS